MLGWVPLPTVPQRLRSYSSLRLPVVFGTNSGVPLPAPTLAATASFLPERPVPSRYVTGHSQEIAVRLPFGRSLPGNKQGLPGYWAVLLPRARCQAPRRLQLPLTIAGTAAAAFQGQEPLGNRDFGIFGAGTPGSRSRLPTLQPPHYWDSSKAGYRPARLGFGRVGFAPTGRLFHHFRATSQPSLPCWTSLAWPQPCRRVALAGYPARAHSDPDLEISTVRLLRQHDSWPPRSPGVEATKVPHGSSWHVTSPLPAGVLVTY